MRSDLKELQPRVWTSITGYRFCCKTKEGVHLSSCTQAKYAPKDTLSLFGHGSIKVELPKQIKSEPEIIDIKCSSCQSLASQVCSVSMLDKTKMSYCCIGCSTRWETVPFSAQMNKKYRVKNGVHEYVGDKGDGSCWRKV
jgi:hypothetical protein